MTTLIETYFAVQIGEHPKDTPYLMINGDGPALFLMKSDAVKRCPKQPRTKVVKVQIHVLNDL